MAAGNFMIAQRAEFRSQNSGVRIQNSEVRIQNGRGMKYRNARNTGNTRNMA